MKKAMLLLTLILMGNSAYSQPNYSYEAQVPAIPSAKAEEKYKINDSTLRGSVITVPAGQSFKAIFTTPISSATATAGQEIIMVLGKDYYYNANRIAPAGSTVKGSVIEASSAKHGSINGKLAVRFTQITTPTGQEIPISAIIKTDDYTGVLVGGTKFDTTKEYTKDVAVGAGAGALAGVVVSPLAGGSIGKGTALATAVGAGGGLVKSIWDKGEDVTIPANASIELILMQPITVNPTSIEN